MNTLNSICQKIRQNKIGLVEHDTLPGLIARMNTENAAKINQIKKRNPTKGFIILIPSLSFLATLTTNINESTQSLMHRYWPGPLTIIFEKQPKISSKITGSPDTIALRFPKHPILTPLLQKINEPLISTSANISQEPHISQTILDQVDFIHGDITGSNDQKSSTIVDGRSNTILRQGAIQLSSLDKFNNPDK